jgi:dipeptidyl aminopeptidase/acylaminoacyl peptidase
MSLSYFARIILTVSGATLAFVSPCAVAAAPAIEDFGKLPAFEEAAISPSGNRVALIATLENVRSLMVVEDGQLISTSKLGDVKVRDVEWASEDRLLIDYSQTEDLEGFTTQKAEFYRTIVMSVSGGEPAIVFAKQLDVADATFGWHGIREIGGRTYGFFGGVPMVSYGGNDYKYEGGSPALYRVDLSDMKAKQIAGRAGQSERRTWLVDAQGEPSITLSRGDNSGIWRLSNAAGKEIAAGKSPSGGIGLVAFGNNGSTVVYYQRDEETAEAQYYEVPILGGQRAEVFTGLDINGFYIDPRTGVLTGYVVDGKPLKRHFFDPAIDKKINQLTQSMLSANLSIIDSSRGYNKVLLRTNGNRDSGTWWLTAKQLGYERPNLIPADVGRISTITYKAADGLEIDGILTLPPGRDAKNLPAIMLPHGGPTSHDTESFDWWAQSFAARGYAVFQPNFRGSTNKDQAFIKAGHGEWGRKMQTDISDGLAHLAAKGIVDPTRACIVGASYGGYASLAGVTLQKGIYRCAVSVAGVSDLAMMVSTDIRESGSDPSLKRNIKAEIGSGRELKDVSPRLFAAQANAPVLLIHGKDDTVVPYKQSTVMADALKDAGKPYEFVTLAGEDHWLSKSNTRLKMLEATINFVEKHNPVQ